MPELIPHMKTPLPLTVSPAKTPAQECLMILYFYDSCLQVEISQFFYNRRDLLLEEEEDRILSTLEMSLLFGIIFEANVWDNNPPCDQH